MRWPSTRCDALPTRFEVVIGDEVHAARTIVLATGVRDTLPDVPGIAEAWGREIAHCPYCHGHEFAGKRVAFIGDATQATHLATLLGNIVSEFVALRRWGREVERTTPGLRVHFDERGGRGLRRHVRRRPR